MDVVTAPRQILPGRTYLLSRRCTQRQYLLRPGRTTNQVLAYCLALAASQTGIVIHAVCAMSNHWHGVVSDPDARLPEFTERFHRLVAKAMNTVLHRWENFWSSEKTSMVHLVSDQDVLEKMAYVIANPVSAGLVQLPEEWTGVCTSYAVSECRMISMPAVFFDPAGHLPKVVPLRVERPKIFSDLSDEQLSARLRDAITSIVRRATRSSASTLSSESAIDPDDSKPRTRAAHFNLNPRIAAKNPASRLDAITKLRDFVRSYREAWSRWKQGVRDVLFPAGTYYLRIHASVPCAPG